MKKSTLFRGSFVALLFMIAPNLSVSQTCGTTINAYPYAESFEGGAFGAWTQGAGDNGNWTNGTGQTPSGGTGPNALANDGSGRYIFTEASSGQSPGSPNQTAFLDSPCFNLTGLTNPQFSFDYHMYGSQMGTLQVQVSINSGTTWAALPTPWIRTGQQHALGTTPWTNTTINLTAFIGQPTLKLRFHGTTGSGYQSDMAVDYVTLVDVVPQPEMNVQGNATTITDGDATPSTADATDFGNVETGGPTGTSTFTIQNTGLVALNLTGASPYVTIGGTNAGDFSVTSIPSNTIAAGGSTTFIITFTPGAVGLRTATLSIANNDADENPYNFSIQGTGILPVTGSNNTTIYYENFDANNGGWTASTNWTYDTTAGSLTAEAGFWRTNTWGNYPTNLNAYLTSPSSISTVGFQNVTFYIDLRHDTDNDPDDGVQIEYTTNAGGTGGWTRLGSNGQGTNWYNDTDVDGIANNEHGWSGKNTENTSSNSKFIEASLPNAVLDNQAVLWFRVRFGSDSSNTDGGAAIDNVIIKGDYITFPGDPSLGPGDVTEDLKLWLKSNNGTSTTTDNTALASWSDQAWSNDAAAYSTYQPLYKDNATDNLNHNPAIEFNRASQHHMKGRGGYHAQDYFIVLKPNEPIDNTGSYRQQPFAGKFSADGFSVDGTGIGFGFISSRYTNAVIAHTISSYPQSGGPNATSYGRAFASSSTTIDEDIMLLNIKTNSTDSSTEIYLNGVRIDNHTGQAGNGADLNFREFDNLVYYLGVGRFTMNGYNPAINSYFDGRIAEVISYSGRRTTTEQQRIHSYLALKYGSTLLSTTNTVGTTETDIDYLDSNGTIVWDYSSNTGFNYDIAGIGRDDNSGLNQKQSSSINGDTDGTGLIEGLLTVGLTDIYNTNNENIALNGSIPLMIDSF